MDDNKHLTRRQLREILRSTRSEQIDVPSVTHDSPLPTSHMFLTEGTDSRLRVEHSERSVDGYTTDLSSPDFPRFMSRKMRRALESYRSSSGEPLEKKTETTPIEVIPSGGDHTKVHFTDSLELHNVSSKIIPQPSAPVAAGVVGTGIDKGKVLHTRRSRRFGTAVGSSLHESPTTTGESREFEARNHSIVATSALVISAPNGPTEMITDTGDVFHTDTVGLPQLISQTGGYTGVLDTSEMQETCDTQNFAIAPVSASRAVCASQTPKNLFYKPKKRIFWGFFISFAIATAVSIGVGLFAIGVILQNSR